MTMIFIFVILKKIQTTNGKVIVAEAKQKWKETAKTTPSVELGNWDMTLKVNGFVLLF